MQYITCNQEVRRIFAMPERKRSGKSSSRQVGTAPRGNWSLAWYFIVPLFLLLAATAPWQRLTGNFFAPYLMLTTAVGDLTADQTLKLRSRTELANEVLRLNQQNVKLIMELEEARTFEGENRRLRAMLKLKNPPGYEYIAAQVILRDPWLWDSGFTIDRGSYDQLKPGLAVVAPMPDGENRVVLLGVIESVAKHTARVTSVLNPEFHISVLLPESGTVGFLNAGSFDKASGGLVPIGFLPANGVFVRNEQLYTTGFESAIPANLWLGSLESVESTTRPFGDRLYRRGLMRPAAELEQLRTVMVARLVRDKSSESTAQQ